MKDFKLFDETLLNLIRMPEAERTAEVIRSHLALAASAAGIKLEAPTDLQTEHIKLSGAAALMAAGMGEGFRHRATLRLGPDLDGIELFASIEAIGRPDVRYTGFGSTAERALAQLRAAIDQNGNTSERRAEKPRYANRSPLRHLPREARRA